MQTDYVIRETGDTYIRLGSMSFHTEAKKAYQRQRDEELGRWRDPVEKDAVVYRMGDWFGSRRVTVSNERNGVSEVAYEKMESQSSEWAREIAARYFEAHPEKKPWHDAKPSEVWALTFSEEGGGGTEAWVVDAHGCFSNPSYVSYVRIQDSTIIDGRRIWPEDEE